MVNECIKYQKNNLIALIKLNRPHVYNALNSELWRGIYDSLERAEKDIAVRAIIITGSTKAFSAGDDIKEVATLKNRESVRAFFLEYAVPTITKIIQLPKPIIAAVSGVAYGGGCEIAMLCDIVVASESATFAIPEALIGAIPPVAAVIGPNVIGKLNTSMMMLTGKPISAKEAKDIGLVNRVVSDGELIKVAEELAENTMQAAPSSIKVMKKLLHKQFRREELEESVEELVNILQTKDGKEGHKAFVEKRAPRWVTSR